MKTHSERPTDAAAALGIESQVPLAPLCTFGVGGPARFLLRVATRDALLNGLRWATQHGLPILPLGDGSNVVFGDEGYSGLVLKMELRGLEWRISGTHSTVTAAAGESWDDLVAQAVARGYGGIECLSGIPGRVGAAPIQNIGAYGQEVGARVVSVRALDPATLQDVELAGPACRFGYRSSVFKESEAGRRLIVLSVDLELEANATPRVQYQELADRLRERATQRSPDLNDVRLAVLELRRQKSMLNDPADPLSRSAGSFFVNPLVTREQARECESRGRAAGVLGPSEALRSFALPDGRLKLSAAWLIEHSGFPRGTRRGNVGLSSKHALALVNYGGARSSEVVDLAWRIRESVAQSFGVWLEPEPALIGLSMSPGRSTTMERAMKELE